MILRIEQLKEICSKLLFAIDNNSELKFAELLEIKTVDSGLDLIVTNREYICKIHVLTSVVENIHATIEAITFLKLVSQITTETVELKIENNSLIVIGNGIYTFPIVYENDTLLELPDISIDVITSKFSVSADTLSKIVNYNSKEITKSAVTHPVQKLFYIDKDGCITFTSGACVTKFKLEKDIKFLLDLKTVKLLKLFNSESVNCIFGHNAINDDITQSVISFYDNDITLTSILTNDNSLINAVPADTIRNVAEDTYEYSVVFNKNLLLQTINRLILFAETANALQSYGVFEFRSDLAIIYDKDKINNEKVFYNNTTLNLLESYEATIDLVDLKIVLSSCKEDYITMNFGNHKSVVIQQLDVYNVIPECTI